MPELPDVEGFRRYFQRYATGRRIRSSSADVDIVRNTTPQALGRALKGQTFEKPTRHGKWLICPAGRSSVLFHFGMTGLLDWTRYTSAEHPHDRLAIHFGDGKLRYRNMRKLGGVWLVRRDEEGEVIGPLGPDAWGIAARDFAELFAGRKRSLKAALMDQTLIAGLGNLTVDEALFHARLNPRRSVASLSDDEMRRLYTKMRHVLRLSIPEGLVPDKKSWMTAARQRDGVCPRCGTGLQRAAVAGRTTYWCPKCQPL